MSYSKLINTHPSMPKGCFFAFSNKQFKEGVEKNELDGVKIYHAGAGLYGTKEAIKAFLNEYDSRAEKIKKECTPQEVYDYEYANHECNWVAEDTEAIKRCLAYFSVEECESITRCNGCLTIQDINKQMKR